MDTKQLRLFVSAAEEMTAVGAARPLSVSEATLSSIRVLESEVGFELLDHAAGSTRLSDAGRLFLETARLELAQSAASAKASAPKAGGKAKASKGRGRAPAVKGQPRSGKKRQSR